MYFFREAEPAKVATCDRFVFASTFEKLPLGETREHHAILPVAWRPSVESGSDIAVQATMPGAWVELPDAAMSAVDPYTSITIPKVVTTSDARLGPTVAHLVAHLKVPTILMANVGGPLWTPHWCDATKRGLEGPANMLRWLQRAASEATTAHRAWSLLPAEDARRRLFEGGPAHAEVAPKLPRFRWLRDALALYTHLRRLRKRRNLSAFKGFAGQRWR